MDEGVWIILGGGHFATFGPLRLVLGAQKSILTNMLFYTIFVLDHLIFALF